MGRSKARNGAARLGKGGGLRTVRMRDAADLWKLTVKDKVSFGVGGGAKGSFHHLPIQIEHHHVIGLQSGVIHAAGLDAPESAGPVDATHVAPGQFDQPAGRQLAIRFADLFFKGLEHGFQWEQGWVFCQVSMRPWAEFDTEK